MRRKPFRLSSGCQPLRVTRALCSTRGNSISRRLNAACTRPGRDFAFVATIPAADGIDIVGAAQYVRANKRSRKTCEFAITVAEDLRGSGLAAKLLASLVRRARRDGYATMEGLVIADNTPMLELARKLKFIVEPVPGDATVVRVQRAL